MIFGQKENRQPCQDPLAEEATNQDFKPLLQSFLQESGLYKYLRTSFVTMHYPVSLKASIVIPNYNGLQFLRGCIEALLHQELPKDQYEIILVDNGSSDGSQKFIKDNYPDLVLIESEKNLGYSGGCNLGIAHSRGAYIVLLNNDTVVDPKWLTELLKVAESDEEIAIVGSKLLFKDKPWIIQNAGSYITETGDGGDIGFGQPDKGQYDTCREVMAACGASMLIKRQVIEEIGALDEAFGSYYEDTDFCYRVRLYGRKIVYAPQSIVYHVHAATLGEWSPLFTFYVFRNKLFLHLKNAPLKYLIKVILLYFLQIFREIKSRQNLLTHLKVLASIIVNFPYLIKKRIYTRIRIRKRPDGEIHLRFSKIGRKIAASEIRKIGVYNAYLPTMGGGERQTAFLVESLKRMFPNASIDLIYHATAAYSRSELMNFDLNQLQTEYDLSLANVSGKIISLVETPDFLKSPVANKLVDLYNLWKITLTTKNYSIFVNNTFNSEATSMAKLSVYYCMFPSKTLRSKNRLFKLITSWLFGRFLRSYHLFLANSHYTQRWIDRYWKVNSLVLYPPIPEKSIENCKEKENVILNIGRFFAGGHNKKQDIMVKAFIQMCDLNWANGWKLVLIGRKHKDRETEIYTQFLENLANNYPIELLYDVSPEVLRHYLRITKIYWHATGYGENPELNPEKFEHFGLSTIEAMQFGAVPIVFNAGGQPEIVKHGVNGFIWNNTNELIQYTKQLMSLDTLRQSYSQSAVDSTRVFSKEVSHQWFRLFLESYVDFG